MEKETYGKEQEKEDMTGFERFQQKVKDGILAYLPKEYRDAVVDIVHVQRNNDQEQVAVAITRNGQTAPARVYLEEYYNRFPDWASDGAILRTIAADYLTEESEMEWKAEMAEAIKDYGSVKGDIRLQVVNRDMNQESLRGCPKREVEGTDLVAVFHVLLYKEGEARASMLVTDRMMEGWGLDMESLYGTALDNTVAQAPAQISSLISIYSDGEEPLTPEKVFSEEQDLYVLSNPQKWHGAAAILYPGLLQSIADASQSSFYVMPCSIHEVMLAKKNDATDVWELQSMVIGSNRYEIPPEEVLSDQVYLYDGKEQKLSLATSPEKSKEHTGNREMNPDGYGGDEAEDIEEEMGR